MGLEETIPLLLGEKKLYGILHRPQNPIAELPWVLMVVGGPQTRVGSHRSYVQIARKLCDQGATVFRFDYIGIGDSDGDWVGYNHAEKSISIALAWMQKEMGKPAIPKIQSRIILWGLCDGAAACLVFGSRLESRLGSRVGSNVSGMILCNPYVHNIQNRAETLIKYYYLRRFMDKNFWTKVFSFQFNPFVFLKSFLELLSSALKSQPKPSSDIDPVEDDPTGFDENTLQTRMIHGIQAFKGRIHIMLSTVDITADQFRTLISSHKELNPAIHKGRLSLQKISGADHTFSTLQHKAAVAQASLIQLKTYL